MWTFRDMLKWALILSFTLTIIICLIFGERVKSVKIKFEINHYNPNKNRMQYNTFHKLTLEEAIESFEDKGFDVNNIRSINKKTTESIEFKHLLTRCCLFCGEPINRHDSFCSDSCKKYFLIG